MSVPRSARSAGSRSAGLKLAGTIGAVILLLDQLTKWAALDQLLDPPRVIEAAPFLNFVLGFNTGVSFGLLENDNPYGPWLLSGAALLVVAVLVVWAARSDSRAEAASFGAIAGGAIGNIVDRLRQGAVTDFIDVHAFGWHWPTFNVADIGITGGVGLLLLSGLWPRKTSGGDGADGSDGARR
ncbi:signal peptidase II [Azospirillum brasilense]|uniref:Lipoprotein signal peptidase n=1 Tax=Azospirillum brasilense TaxID=192 RepID=A0A560CDJ8_AZOBR|nr:signal peptidase II [Azospirillum brasilense]MBK3733718.1 signal peptidase II [Azospirillum brasilense]TWA82915.1 signal peptidase II [Azospirillum brasilense]